MLYQVAEAPDSLPPVRPRDLAACWDAARSLALAGDAAPSRRIRFLAASGPIDLHLADPDAACWAAAVDARAALTTRYGLALCLRLLALVSLLARSGAARAECTLSGGEALLSARLLGAAARTRLSPNGQFADGLET